jgi:hypothetical protein
MTNGIIVDTSIWIDYFNNVVNEQTNTADKFLESKSVFILPVILQEILQGIREEKKFHSIKDLLLYLNFFQVDTIKCAIDAASIFRFLKTKGITVRKPNDCLIAAVCIENKISLLHNDKDFDKIAKHTSLKIYKNKE